MPEDDSNLTNNDWSRGVDDPNRKRNIILTLVGLGVTIGLFLIIQFFKP